MNNDLNVLLKVILDSSNIGNSDILKIQKILDKYSVNITANLDKTQLINSIKEILPQVLKEFNKLSDTEIKINIDEKAIEKAINKIIQNEKHLKKEADSTAQYIKLVKDSINSISQSGLSGLKKIGTSIKGILIDKGISLLVNGFVNLRKELFPTQEEIHRLGEEARNSANEIIAKFETTKSTVDSIITRYSM